MTLSLSVIIPCFNEARTLKSMIEQVASQKPLVRQIIVANDGSNDNTKQVIDDVARSWPHPDISFRVTHLSSNKGKGAAVRAALILVEQPHVLIQDADLELDPSNYAALAQPLENRSAQVVFGNRFPGGFPAQIRLASRVANTIVTGLSNVFFGLHLKDQACGYKLLPTALAKGLRLQSDGFEICSEMTAKLGLRHTSIASVAVRYNPRDTTQGKKIRWVDGFIAVQTLLYYRLSFLFGNNS